MPRLLLRLQFEQIANHSWIANENIFGVEQPAIEGTWYFGGTTQVKCRVPFASRPLLPPTIVGLIHG